MAGVWTPTDTLLGTHIELETFSHSITYIEPAGEGDPLADPPVDATQEVRWTVRVIPLETNSPTVIFTTGDPAIVSGYFKRVFNDTIQYKTFDKRIVTAVTDPDNGAWDKVINSEVYEATSFKADTSRNIIKNYRAEAFNNDPASPHYLEIVATKNYTINIKDLNWTTGQTLLKQLVTTTQSR
jgi:hypothetical protein